MKPSYLQAERSAPYTNPSYETVLERDAGSYMGKSKPGVTEASERLCQTLRYQANIPRIFPTRPAKDYLVKMIAMIIKHCTRLVVPSAKPMHRLAPTTSLILRLKVSMKAEQLKPYYQAPSAARVCYRLQAVCIL